MIILRYYTCWINNVNVDCILLFVLLLVVYNILVYFYYIYIYIYICYTDNLSHINVWLHKHIFNLFNNIILKIT